MNELDIKKVNKKKFPEFPGAYLILRDKNIIGLTRLVGRKHEVFMKGAKGKKATEFIYWGTHFRRDILSAGVTP